MVQEWLAGKHTEDPLTREEGPGPSAELPDGSLALAGDSLQGLQQKLGEALALLDISVKIPESSTEFASLRHLYLPYLHCYLRCMLHFPSLVDRLVDRIGTYVA
jgi:hypothetical protein